MNHLPDYILLNPTGNITVLVTTPVNISERLRISDQIMQREPLAEQLGFLSAADDADICLNMAGGEFCGNATMCAAVWLADKKKIDNGRLTIRVSGAEKPVSVDVIKRPDESWAGTVEMLAPVSMADYAFSDGHTYPLVRFSGIDHIICLTENSKINRADWETTIKLYSRELNSMCTGIMLLDISQNILTPLVYAPGAGTLIWEHSCASGTTACGAWLYLQNQVNKISLTEPGGVLSVEVSSSGRLYLSGTVSFISHSAV